MRLTGNGRTVAAVGPLTIVAGVALHHSPLVLVGTGLVLAVIGAAVVTVVRSPQRTILAVERSVEPNRGVENEAATLRLLVSNLGDRRTVPLAIRVGLSTGPPAIVHLASLAPQESGTVRVPLPRLERGHHRVGPIRISFSDPLGLISFVLHHTDPFPFVVHPGVRLVPPLAGVPTVGSEDDASTLGERGGIAFHSLRDYVAGDDLRLIHWRSSARTGTLTVRNEASVDRHDLILVLDTAAASYDDPAHFDETVRVVASLAAAGAWTGRSTAVVTSAGAGSILSGDARDLTAVLDILAGAVVDADPIVAPLSGRNRYTRNGSLGIVSGQIGGDRMKTLLAACEPAPADVTLVQVGPLDGRPTLRLAGVRTIRCRDVSDLTGPARRLVP